MCLAVAGELNPPPLSTMWSPHVIFPDKDLWPGLGQLWRQMAGIGLVLCQDRPLDPPGVG